MDDIVNAAKSKALNVAEFFTPVLKESKFKETGVLTPEEFVVAGDHLVHHCPTWQWSAGAASQTKPYLPKDKQMLITRSVPCYRRCWQIDYLGDQEKILDGDDADGGWVDTHHFSADTATDKVREMTLDSKKSADNATASKRGDSHSDDEGEAADMEAFLEREMGIEDENDPNAYYPDKQDVVKDADGEILKTRTYDLNITYDKYYQVPRMWLIGYNENQRLLTVDQMYEDFSQDHAKKTVTVENHPNLPGPPMASIHPCRHAQVMKRLIEQLADNGKELYVHQ